MINFYVCGRDLWSQCTDIQNLLNAPNNQILFQKVINGILKGLFNRFFYPRLGDTAKQRDFELRSRRAQIRS